ncbi:unnamed protein product [Spirodela intermedia]|uniref:Uncharacterized protein n=1 Tax=Spirodela intermedia TaxID=51605 RepID=A0A7I8J2Q2_SPIIN|nr:unnamed protein product [Spirodela intermedia]CAA6664407.1 unnamed protein product [Spirodela intermedia]
MLLPLISRSFAVLSGLSEAACGASPSKMLFPLSSANFWLWIFFERHQINTAQNQYTRHYPSLPLDSSPFSPANMPLPVISFHLEPEHCFL